MSPVSCPTLNGGLRISITRGDTNPDVVMAYAHTMGAVSVQKNGTLKYHIRGWYGEPGDIDEITLRAYLDPAGTCARNNPKGA